MCTEQVCQNSVPSSDAICGIPSKDGHALQNGCEKDVGQRVPAAETNSDMHNTLEHQGVLTAMRGIDNVNNTSKHQTVSYTMSSCDIVHNVSEEYSEENTSKTLEYQSNTENPSQDVQQ